MERRRAAQAQPLTYNVIELVRDGAGPRAVVPALELAFMETSLRSRADFVAIRVPCAQVAFVDGVGLAQELARDAARSLRR